jgi:glucan 1,3-beta-glucosidase
MNLDIRNCPVGIDITAGGSNAQSVGSMVIDGAIFTNVGVAIASAFTTNSVPKTAGSLILENVSFNNVGAGVQTPDGIVLDGSSGSRTVAAWGQGHSYVPNGPNRFQGYIQPASRPTELLSGGRYYTRTKPQYESLTAGDVISARTYGARGDGSSDDV